MAFAHQLRKLAGPLWKQTLDHPLVRGIGDGSLPVEQFTFYVRQDYIFLIEYSRVLALATAKGDSLASMDHFAGLLHVTLHEEMELHRRYAEKFGISRRALEATQPAPTTIAYTKYLVDTAALGSIGEIAAALLPCQWGYAEIGRILYRRGLPRGKPLYAEWIRTYAAPEFQTLARWLVSYVDRVGRRAGPDERKRMAGRFRDATRLEYLFWEMAARREGWPV